MHISTTAISTRSSDRPARASRTDRGNDPIDVAALQGDVTYYRKAPRPVAQTLATFPSFFLARWPQGYCTIVFASDERDLQLSLDRLADPSVAELHQLDHGMIHFRLGDDGWLQLHEFEYETESEIMQKAYPRLHIFRKSSDPDSEDEKQLAMAIQAEKTRSLDAPTPLLPWGPTLRVAP